MYQICLVIKEDLNEEWASMLISGHETISEAAEQILIDFERLQNANEVSAEVDNWLASLNDLTPQQIADAMVVLSEGSLL